MIYHGDALTTLKDMKSESVDCVVTSPPYWGLRDYGVEGQLGHEKTPEEYVSKMVELFKKTKRVLKKKGTFWLNLGDSYMGGGFGVTADGAKITGKQSTNRGTENLETRKKLGALKKSHETIKTKDLVGIPWRVAFALQADGWYLRQDIIWHKPNPMPESVTDRCTKSHEYVFLLSKSKKYFFDNQSIKEETNTYDEVLRDRETTKLNNVPGRTKMKGLVNNNHEMRNKRSVWTVATNPFKEAHFATFPEALIAPMILAGCPKNGTVLDPFAGAGTTGVVAQKLSRKFIGIELNREYITMAERRIKGTPVPML